jgi:hypothetical protein
METTAGVTCAATAAKAFCVSTKGAMAAADGGVPGFAV